MKNISLALVFVFAFLIRLIGLNQSLWLDEATTARVVKEYGFSQIISEFSANDFHPPLYYLFMKGWTNIFGYSEIALRMPSVLFSLMTGWLAYLIGKRFYKDSGPNFVKTTMGKQARMTKEHVSLLAATFFLFNPLIVYYSQEARMYMMATLFLTAALYYFTRLCHPEFTRLAFGSSKRVSGSRNPSILLRTGKFGMTKLSDLLLFNLFIILSFVTFYGSIFLIAAFLVYFLYKKEYRNLIICLLVVFGYFLLISPLLYQQLLNAKVNLTNVTNWTYVLGKANLKNLLLIPVKFTVGRISFEPKILYWGVSGFWGGLVFLQVIKNGFKNKFLLFLLIFPIFLGFLISFFTPLLQYFRFVYLISIMAILLSFSLSDKAEYDLVGHVLAGGFIIFSLVYLLFPQFHREDWKSLAKSLPKDKPVYMITSSSDPITYYNNSLRVKELTSLRVNELGKEIYVIPYSADIHGVKYEKILKDRDYALKSKKTFRGLELEKWGLKEFKGS